MFYSRTLYGRFLKVVPGWSQWRNYLEAYFIQRKAIYKESLYKIITRAMRKHLQVVYACVPLSI